MTAAPDLLRDIADRLRRLGPDRRDPEKYHEEKSELVAALRRLAREAEIGTMPPLHGGNATGNRR